MLPACSSATLFILCLLSWILQGCAGPGFRLPEGFSPFGPVNITFESFTPDLETETLLTEKVSYPDGPFLKDVEGKSPERLHIFYKRQPDLKSMGKILLSGGLGPVEADYTYILHLQHYSGETLLQEYHYLEQVQEETYSTFDDIINPFYDPRGRSEEIFTLLCDRLLQDVVRGNSAPVQ